MMVAYELRYILNTVKEFKNLSNGDVFFLDKNGQKHVIDYLFMDEDENLILTEYTEEKCG